MPSVGTTTLGIRRLSVVGESFYQDNIRKFKRRKNLIATLTPDRRNKHDKNAVRVTIRRTIRSLQVGHLSREDAKKWQPVIIAANKAGDVVELPARLTGGTKAAPTFGVVLGESYG